MFKSFNTTTRIIIGAVVAVLIWLTGVVIGQEQTVTILDPSGGLYSILNRTPLIKVSLMIDYQNGQVEVYPETEITYSQTVLDVINKINRGKAEGDQINISYNQNEVEGTISNLSINGYQSRTGGKQWQVWLNNRLQTDDLAGIKLKASDVIELKYINLQN